MASYSRDVNLQGVVVEESVKDRQREKLGVLKYCMLPGVLNAASRVSVVVTLALISPSLLNFLRQAWNSAAMKMLITQTFRSLHLNESKSVLERRLP